MENYTDGIMNVSLYETRADTTTFMAAEAGESEARKAAGDSATDVLQLCAEVRRLQALQESVKELLAEKKATLLEKYEDLATCSERGWDEGHERITAEVWALRGEIKMLEKLLA